MTLKGNLATVNLADVFQTLSAEHSTGLLRIQAPEGGRFVEIEDGQISIVARAANRILLGDLLLSRELINEDTLHKALSVQKETGTLLGQILLDMSLIQLADIENALRFQVEEEICDLFLLKSAEFEFLTSAKLEAKMALGGGIVRLKMDSNGLLQEAARRTTEWQRIEKRITSQGMIFALEAEGQTLLSNGEGLSREGLILLHLISSGCTAEAMVQKACMGRLDTNALLLELWDAGMISVASTEVCLATARKHLNEGRLDEAERVVRHGALSARDAAGKNTLEPLAAEIERKKKTGVGVTTETANTRSEVIRRPNPALIINKKRAPLAYVLAVVVVLGFAGGGVYWRFFHNVGPAVSVEEQRQYDVKAHSVEEFISQGQYEDAWSMLNWNPSHPQLRDKVRQDIEKFEKFMTTRVRDLSERFHKADHDVEIKKISTEVQRLEKMGLCSSGPLKDMLADLKKSIRTQDDLKRLQKFAEVLQQLETKDANCKECEATLKQMLAEDPPEAAGVKIRTRLASLLERKRKAQQAYDLGLGLRRAGAGTLAKLEYDTVTKLYPGSDLATLAEAESAGLVDEMRKAEGLLSQVQALQYQKKTDEAKVALLQFLDKNPEQGYADRARTRLREIVGGEDELEAEKAFAQAEMLEQKKDFDAARTLKIDTAVKYPRTMTVSKLRLNVEVSSAPTGAQILLNGVDTRAVTPSSVATPAMGPVRITLRVQGHADADIVARDFREKSVQRRLERLPVDPERPFRFLPAPPTAGMAAHGEYVAVVADSEVYVVNYGLKDEEELFRRSFASLQAPVAGLRPLSQPVLGSATTKEEPEVFLATCEKRVWRLRSDGSKAGTLELSSIPVSRACVVTEQGSRPVYLAGIETVDGFEVLELATGQRRFDPRKFKGGASPASLGGAFDGVTFFVPRANGRMYTVNAKEAQGWDVEMPAGALAPAACLLGSKTVAVAGAAGNVTVWEAESEQVVYTHDLGEGLAFGLIAAGPGYLAVTEKGKLIMLAPREAKTLWAKDLGRAVKFFPETGDRYVAVLLEDELLLLDAASGDEIWHAKFMSPSAGLATSGARIYVCTQDARIYRYEASK